MTDLRDAIRALRATPGFTLVALLVLTLGIGATTAIFSVVDAMVLRGMPFDEHDRLVAVGERGNGGGGKKVIGPPGAPAPDPLAIRGVQPQNYLDWIAQQQVFASMAAVWDAAPTLRLPGAEPGELSAERVTAGCSSRSISECWPQPRACRSSRGSWPASSLPCSSRSPI
jgi:hypothetical protein